MGSNVWLHGSCRSLLESPLMKEAESSMPPDFSWNVLKHDEARRTFSFIHSPDFDGCEEPSVGNVWAWRADTGGRLIRPPADPWIYHHRWTMVRDDYEGFDVGASIRRSIAWKTAFGRDSLLSSRIGRRSVWRAELSRRMPNGLI